MVKIFIVLIPLSDSLIDGAVATGFPGSLVTIDTSEHSLIDNPGARHAVQIHFVRAPEYGIVGVLNNGSRAGEAVDTCADGKEFVRVGVKPQIAAHPTVAGFRAGKDTVLERAVEEIGRNLSPNRESSRR